MKHVIRVKRVYDPPEPEDGRRFLVDRLWPRGVKKESLRLDAWLKDVAPSHELRKFFHAHPERWDEFVQRYEAELEAKPEVWSVLLGALREGPITLLYSSRNRERNNAVVLKRFLMKKLQESGSSGDEG